MRHCGMHFTWHAGCLVSSRAGAAVSSKRPSRVSIVKFYEMKKDSQSQEWPRHTPLLCYSPVRSRPKVGNGHEERSFHVAKTRVKYIQAPTCLIRVHVHGQSSRSCSRVTVPRRRSVRRDVAADHRSPAHQRFDPSEPYGLVILGRSTPPMS